MTKLYSNNFDAAANGLLAGWDNFAGGFNVGAPTLPAKPVSGTKAYLQQNVGVRSFYSASGLLADQELRVAHYIPTLAPSGFRFVTLGLRSQDFTDATGYRFQLITTDGTGLVARFVKDAGGGAVIGTPSSGAFAPAPTDLVHRAFRIIGDTLTACAWLNNNPRPTAPVSSATEVFITVTDTLYATGYPFVQCDSAANGLQAAIDNLVVTDGAGGEDFFYNGTTPVSFSGPVPTRNGVLGTASTFPNAGFFAGSQTPFTYSSVGTALPAGVTLNTSTGVLNLAASGATAGTTSGIIIRATDSSGNVANTNAYSIVIVASNAAPTFPGNISNLSGTAGSAITPVNVSGQFSDTDALTYSASPAGTAWPSGLVVNSGTGIISGTVASAGTTSGLKVRATDTNASAVDSNAFNVVIAAAGAVATMTATRRLVAGGDGQTVDRANLAIHADVHSLTTGALVVRKTGLTTNSAGLPPPFTSSALAAGTQYDVKFIDDANPARRSLEIITAA